jgi:hypothetical protein
MLSAESKTSLTLYLQSILSSWFRQLWVCFEMGDDLDECDDDPLISKIQKLQKTTPFVRHRTSDRAFPDLENAIR